MLLASGRRPKRCQPITQTWCCLLSDLPPASNNHRTPRRLHHLCRPPSALPHPTLQQIEQRALCGIVSPPQAGDSIQTCMVGARATSAQREQSPHVERCRVSTWLCYWNHGCGVASARRTPRNTTTHLGDVKLERRNICLTPRPRPESGPVNGDCGVLQMLSRGSALHRRGRKRRDDRRRRPVVAPTSVPWSHVLDVALQATSERRGAEHRCKVMEAALDMRPSVGRLWGTRLWASAAAPRRCRGSRNATNGSTSRPLGCSRRKLNPSARRRLSPR